MAEKPEGEETCASDDTELPIINLTPKKIKGFEENSIVWCKWRNDYWPALVKKLYNRQKKMTVVFADLPCDQRGKEYKITVFYRNVVKFDSSEKSRNLLLKGMQGSMEQKDAIEKARDFIVKQGIGDLHVSPVEFLNNPTDNVMAQIRAESNGIKLTKRKILTEDSGEETIVLKKQHLDSGEMSEEYESSDEALEPSVKDERSDTEKAFSDSILKAIRTPECLERLVNILEEKEESKRHNWFNHGTPSERRQLRHLKFHHIVSAKQFEAILVYLRAEMEKRTSVSRFHILNYALDVWTPEALMYGLQVVLNVNKQRAEASLLTGKLPLV